MLAPKLKIFGVVVMVNQEVGRGDKKGQLHILVTCADHTVPQMKVWTSTGTGCDLHREAQAAAAGEVKPVNL